MRTLELLRNERHLIDIAKTVESASAVEMWCASIRQTTFPRISLHFLKMTERA
jgi:hypothetical protein